MRVYALRDLGYSPYVMEMCIRDSASIDRATGKIIPITREGGQDEMNALIERLRCV